MAVKDSYKWPEYFGIGVLPPTGGLDTSNVVKKLAQVITKDTGMKVNLATASDKATKSK